ncbi:hypothetical protein [Microbacterium arborescens]|uniref:hypothetical protein n=1 Tax=Microbacterium arborescens TaxID=33883 RepID=UPI002788FBE8|nr:hypothetical protein [Microbacterium arborescens]MDQ1217993.1 hypothetical protein [Microbacterium arborescens]
MTDEKQTPDADDEAFENAFPQNDEAFEQAFPNRDEEFERAFPPSETDIRDVKF